MTEKPGSRRSELATDLAQLAIVERRSAGPPPSEEELLALSRGELAEDEAERLRNFLSLHPDWAQAYLDFCRGADAGSSEQGAPDDVPIAGDDDELRQRRVWRAVAKRLELRSRRQSPARWLPLAALLAVAILVGLFFRFGETEPAYEIRLLAQPRGSQVEVPRSARQVELVAPIQDRVPAGTYEIVLRTPEGDFAPAEVASAVEEIVAGQETVSIVIPADRLVEDLTHRFEIRPIDPQGEPGEALSLGEFQLRFID